jgi:hypothetical protein
MPWLREDPEYLRKPFFSTFALVCEQSPFLVFDKLSSAAEDHTPASCRPRQKGDHHFDLDMPGTFSRLHQRSPDSRGIVSFVLCVPVAPQNPKRLRRLLSRAICITETAFLYCNHNGAGPSCARPAGRRNAPRPLLSDPIDPRSRIEKSQPKPPSTLP